MRFNTLSIVIPTYKQRQLNDCLESLTRQTYRKFEVIVVENGCPGSETVSLVEHYRSQLDIQYHFEPQPGSNRARNRGTTLARHALIGLIDDDVIVDAGWVEAVLQAHTTYPDAGVIGGKVDLAFLANRPAWCIGNFARMLAALDYGPDTCELHGPNPYRPSYLISANLSYRRAIFEKAGGFYEKPGLMDNTNTYNEEFAFIETARQYGRPGMMYVPGMRVTHQIPPERATLAYMLRRAYGQGVSDIVLYKRCSLTWTDRDLLRLLEERLFQSRSLYDEMVADRHGLPATDQDVFTEYFLAHRLMYLQGLNDAIHNKVSCDPITDHYRDATRAGVATIAPASLTGAEVLAGSIPGVASGFGQKG